MLTATNVPVGLSLRVYATNGYLHSTSAASVNGTVTASVSIASCFVLFAGPNGNAVGQASSQIDNPNGQTISYLDVQLAQRYGRVSFDWDDGNIGVFTLGRQLFSEFGIKVRAGLIPSIQEAADGIESPTWAQIEAFAADGHSIYNHSWSHVGLTTLNATDLSYEVEHSKQVLASHGFTMDYFVYPMAMYNQAVLNEVGAHYTWGRGATGYNEIAPNPSLLLASNGLVDATKCAYARDNNKWSIWLYHGLCSVGATDEFDSPLINDGYHIDTNMLRQAFATMLMSGVGYDQLVPTVAAYDFRLDFYGGSVPLPSGYEDPERIDLAALKLVRPLGAIQEPVTASDSAVMAAIAKLATPFVEQGSPEDTAALAAVLALGYDFAIEFYAGGISLPEAAEQVGLPDTALLNVVKSLGQMVETGSLPDLYAVVGQVGDWENRDKLKLPFIRPASVSAQWVLDTASTSPWKRE